MLLLPAAPLQGQSTLRGTLHAVWDGDTGFAGEAVQYFLVDDAGRSYALNLSGIPVEDVRRLERQRVELTTAGAIVADAPLRISSLRPRGSAPAPSASVTPLPFITLLCRFGDDPAEPFPAAVLQTTLGHNYPGVAQYYGELAQDPLVMAGNETIGWLTLPRPRSNYVEGNTTRFGDLFNDCVQAADANVDFSRFYGINLQFGGPLSTRPTAPFDTLSFGGSWSGALDGPPRTFGVTWISRNHRQNFVVYTHEMGHALGWPHSSGRYGEEYDSRWDLMSVGYLRQEQPWGWLSIHTIAPYKDRAGFIPPNRKWLPTSGIETAEIVRSALPPATGYLMAEIPISNGRSYTVETRMFAGHDHPLPAEAVVIHEVVQNRAYVIDPDNNRNPNDEGAIWRPGETFFDAANSIAISIVGATEHGFQVRIQRTFAPVVIDSDSVLRSAAAGEFYSDTLRAHGGIQGMITWFGTSGALPPGLAIDATSGRISGAPTSRGIYRFGARAVSGDQNAENSFRITVHDPVRITQASRRRVALLGTPYADTLRASGGTGHFDWTVVSGRLPTGLTFDEKTGVVAGVPSENGTREFTVRAESDGLYHTGALTYVVYAPTNIAASAVMEHLLGTTPLSATDAEYLDLIGNQNGRIDIGDVRLWLISRGELPTSAATAEAVMSTLQRTASKPRKGR